MVTCHDAVNALGVRFGRSALTLLLAAALVWGTADRADATDWTDVTAGNVADWSKATGDSSRTNFLNTAGITNGNVLTVRDMNTAGGSVPPRITGSIYGAYSSNTTSGIPINTDAVTLDGNSVTVFAPTSGSVSALSGNVSVFGGYKYFSHSGSGDPGVTRSISNNTVTIHSGVNLGTGAVAGALLNGRQLPSTVERMQGNSVIIYGGTMRSVFGAVADTQVLNTMSVDNNAVLVDLRGGGSLTMTLRTTAEPGEKNPGDGNIYGADFHGGSVTNNSVRFYADNSSTINAVYSVFGGRSGFFPGEASDNSVLIDMSAKTTPTAAFANIVGGASGSLSIENIAITFGANEAYRNTVEIYGTPAAGVEVGSVTGGRTLNGIAAHNSVYLADVHVTGALSGGYTEQSTRSVVGITDATEGVADNNSVTVVRGAIGGNIYGGFDDSATGRSASGNSVSLADTVIASPEVYGGYSRGESKNNAVRIAGYGTSFTHPAAVLAGGNNPGRNGNTLTTSVARDLRLDRIENFDSYVFNMTGNEMGKTVYTVNRPVNLAGTDHTLNFDATVGPPLHEGQVMVLIDKSENGNTLSNDKFVQNIRDGFLYNYEGYFGMKGDSLVFEITGKQQDERNITFSHAQLVGLQMVNVASDLARSVHNLYDMRCAPECRDNPDDPVCRERRPEGETVAFVGTQAGSYYWNTGSSSRVDLDFFSAIAGLGRRTDNLLVAGFFETGVGSYDAKVRGAKIVDGDDTKYVGGGALIRYERNNFYGETGFHAGRVYTDFESRKFGVESAPFRVEYENKATYLGVDALVGYTMDIDCSTLDFSARYSWNHLDGDNFTAHGARFNQGAADSHRIRAGAEWRYSKNAFHPYAGAFYEYEADSDSSHEVHGEEVRRVSLTGSTGIGKLGLRFGGGEHRLSLDIGVEGHVGERRGVVGKAMLGYAF